MLRISSTLPNISWSIFCILFNLACGILGFKRLFTFFKFCSALISLLTSGKLTSFTCFFFLFRFFFFPLFSSPFLMSLVDFPSIISTISSILLFHIGDFSYEAMLFFLFVFSSSIKVISSSDSLIESNIFFLLSNQI